MKFRVRTNKGKENIASMCYLIIFCIFYMYDDFIYYIVLYRISALQMDHYDYALYIHTWAELP